MSARGYDVATVRRDFPILTREQRGKPLVYLDSSASAQKPRAVIDAIAHFYAHDYASIHRGVYELSERATAAYEGVRERTARFLGAADAREIVFVRNATEAVNLVAATFGRQRVGPGDEVLITHMEHHANIVPWHMLCEAVGARLVVAPMDDTGTLDMDAFHERLGERTRMVGVVHVSNALGTVNPVAEITALAHARGVPVLVDGAQSVPHMPVDVREIGCDFFVFSGHKTYGPTGAGVLWARGEHLEAMPPYQGGGSMIASVEFDEIRYAPPPQRFEAGTPDIAGVIGLGAALDYMEGLGVANIALHEAGLLEYGTELLESIPGLRLVGTAKRKAGVLSFVLDGVHPHDVGTILDQEGVAIRAGHHCAQPTMARMGVPATARASLGLMNDRADLDALARGIRRAIEIFA